MICDIFYLWFLSLFFFIFIVLIIFFMLFVNRFFMQIFVFVSKLSINCDLQYLTAVSDGLIELICRKSLPLIWSLFYSSLSFMFSRSPLFVLILLDYFICWPLSIYVLFKLICVLFCYFLLYCLFTSIVLYYLFY